MIALTAAEIANITNGRLAADPAIKPLSVVTDSREASPGSLYVAKPGENADGHDFVGSAFDRGAVLALVEHDIADAAGKPCTRRCTKISNPARVEPRRTTKIKSATTVPAACLAFPS